MDKTQIQAILDSDPFITEAYLELLNGINVGIFVQNHETKVIACNDSSLDLLGISFEQAFGTTAYDPKWKVIAEDGNIFPPEAYPISIAASTNRTCKEVVMGIFRPNSEDLAWLLVSAVPIVRSTDGSKQIIVTFTDISERVKKSHEISLKNKDLLKINELMVDRELKMVQLKKELSEVTKQQ